MKKNIRNNIFYRSIYNKYELNFCYESYFRKFLKQKKENNKSLYLKSVKTKLRNVCIWTGHTKGVLTKFKLNRCQSKEYLRGASLAGFTKNK